MLKKRNFSEIVKLMRYGCINISRNFEVERVVIVYVKYIGNIIVELFFNHTFYEKNVKLELHAPLTT